MAPRALNADVLILGLCQAMMTSTNSLVVACSALVGVMLASDPLLGTLPAALQHLGTLSLTVPAGRWMARRGRRSGFVLAAVIGIGGGALAVAGILGRDFWLFCAGTALFGAHNAFGNFYRFAAVEAVEPAAKSRAISYVLAGGVLAAALGPSIAAWTRDSVATAPFAGSFAAVIGLYVIAMAALTRLRLRTPLAEPGQGGGRSALTVLRQPRARVALLCAASGFALMTLLMVATPLAMAGHGHPFGDTALVIQFHVLAMFLPSFVTGDLIDRFGQRAVMACGAVLGLVCIAVALSGGGFWAFWSALLALGLSWNFLFVGATSLLTECYEPAERARVQAANDLVVFSCVGLCAFAAGALQSQFGWSALCLLAAPFYVGTLFALWRLPVPVAAAARGAA